MVEAQNVSIRPEVRSVTLLAALQREVHRFAKKESYRSLPYRMKRIAKKAAFKALLIPRNELYEILEIMEKAGDEAHQNLMASREEAKRFMSRMHFSENQRSRYLTKLDRELVAAATVRQSLVEQGYDNLGENNRQLLEATQQLSRDLVGVTHKRLPKFEQWDKNARTILPEERILFTANLIPQSVDWELPRKLHRKKRKRKK